MKVHNDTKAAAANEFLIISDSLLIPTGKRNAVCFLHLFNAMQRLPERDPKNSWKKIPYGHAMQMDCNAQCSQPDAISTIGACDLQHSPSLLL
jgi:hypothetical protein